jgi:hypothetical protein
MIVDDFADIAKRANLRALDGTPQNVVPVTQGLVDRIGALVEGVDPEPDWYAMQRGVQAQANDFFKQMRQQGHQSGLAVLGGRQGLQQRGLGSLYPNQAKACCLDDYPPYDAIAAKYRAGEQDPA